MRPTISVTALHGFVWQGQSVTAGQTFQVSPVEALALTYQKKAKFTRAIPRHVPTPEPEPDKPKGRYRRRDLRADE